MSRIDAIDSMREKKCKKCGDIKPVSEFYVRTNRKDGYDSNCKSCCIKESTINNKKNPNTNENVNKYRRKKREKINAQARENSKKNYSPEKQKEYYLRKKEKLISKLFKKDK